MYVSHNEGANFWLGVITDLKQQGVDDILIACIDNLKGFDQAIGTFFRTRKYKAASFIKFVTA
jgi:putative transposase